MGGFLSAPVTTKLLEEHCHAGADGGPGFRAGVASMNGWREAMEDSHVVRNGRNCAVFGVFDGHGGSDCSQFMASRISEEIAKQNSVSDQDIEEISLALDKEYMTSMPDSGAGSTGTFMIAQQIKRADGVQEYEIQVANVGDSRIILCDKDGETTTALTVDHKPSDEEELFRITAADGTVFNDRVNGDLAMSRAFGDSRYKCGGKDQRTHQVTAVPDVKHTRVFAGDIIVACCDGVLENDCFTEKSLMQFVHQQIGAASRSQIDLAAVAATVCDEAIERGSRDNVTCMIILLGEVGDAESTMEKTVSPGPVSLPGSITFMAAYEAAANCAGISTAECASKRYELASGDEKQAFKPPETITELPVDNPTRIRWFESWLSDSANSHRTDDSLGSEEVRFSPPERALAAAAQRQREKDDDGTVGEKIIQNEEDNQEDQTVNGSINTSTGSTAWWEVLEALEAEVETDEEHSSGEGKPIGDGDGDCDGGDSDPEAKQLSEQQFLYTSDSDSDCDTLLNNCIVQKSYFVNHEEPLTKRHCPEDDDIE